MIWAAFWSVTEPALAIANSCAPMLRPILKAAFPSLFASAQSGYSTQPASGPINKSTPSRRMDRMDEMDSEYPLTRLPGDTRSADEGSLNDQSQDGRSQDVPYHISKSVMMSLKGQS